MDKPLISIITVTRNDLVGFNKTYASVIPLLKYNVEWIIKDGGSHQLIIEKIKSMLQNEKIIFISGKDSGTYNAMNISLTKSKGDWVIFLNGGDSFYSKNFLDEFKNHIYTNKLNYYENNIILGNYYLLYPHGGGNHVKSKKISDCLGLNSYRMPTCHQAQFFSKAIYENLKFNENLKISSDHAYFWSAVQRNSKISYIDLTICNFTTGGSSYKKHIKSIWDIRFSLINIQKINKIIIIFALLKRFIAFYIIVLREILVTKFNK